jgi:hypothetical protein
VFRGTAFKNTCFLDVDLYSQLAQTNTPLIMPEIPKKRGRPRLYFKEEKARRDVVSKRMRRQARSAAARQNSTRFQTHTAEQVRAVPLSIPHETHFQSLTSLKVPADATTSQVTTSQPGQLRDLSHETRVYSCNPLSLL